jgi:predicted nucleotidyltransferase
MKLVSEYDVLSVEDVALLSRVRKAISKVEPSAQVILYGSRARGDAGGESDYDLLIITDGEATLKREDLIRGEVFPIELETGAVLTVILLSEHEWESSLYRAMPFCQNVRNEGVAL